MRWSTKSLGAARSVFFNLPVHRVGIFRVLLVAVAVVDLAEGAFLAPALAALLEAAEFGAAMVSTSDLFAGQRQTVKI